MKEFSDLATLEIFKPVDLPRPNDEGSVTLTRNGKPYGALVTLDDLRWLREQDRREERPAR
jgi:hypothetical protein